MDSQDPNNYSALEIEQCINILRKFAEDGEAFCLEQSTALFPFSATLSCVTS